MKAAAALLILSATLCAAQKPKVKTEWDYRNEGQQGNITSTRVLLKFEFGRHFFSQSLLALSVICS